MQAEPTLTQRGSYERQLMRDNTITELSKIEQIARLLAETATRQYITHEHPRVMYIGPGMYYPSLQKILYGANFTTDKTERANIIIYRPSRFPETGELNTLYCQLEPGGVLVAVLTTPLVGRVARTPILFSYWLAEHEWSSTPVPLFGLRTVRYTVYAPQEKP